MSSAEQLRRITAQERLRSDHLAMMEMLQASENENMSLKAEVARLKGQIARGVEEAPSIESSGSAESMAVLVQRVMTQDSTIKELTADNKVLKSKLASSELEARNLKKASSANDKMRRELNEMLTLQKRLDQDEADAEARLLSLRQQVAEKEATDEAYAALLLHHAALQSSSEQRNQAQLARVTALEGRVAELEENNATSDAALAVKQARISTLELTLREMTRVQNDSEAALSDRCHAQGLELERSRAEAVAAKREATLLRTQVSELEARCQALTQELEQAQAIGIGIGIKPNPLLDPTVCRQCGEADLSDLGPQASMLFLTGASAPPAAPAPRGQGQSALDALALSSSSSSSSSSGYGYGSGAPSGLFEEFIRLKKENRQLRLQLLSVQTQGQGQGQGQGQRQNIARSASEKRVPLR
jgi:hypothetical protein